MGIKAQLKRAIVFKFMSKFMSKLLKLFVLYLLIVFDEYVLLKLEPIVNQI